MNQNQLCVFCTCKNKSYVVESEEVFSLACLEINLKTQEQQLVKTLIWLEGSSSDQKAIASKFLVASSRMSYVSNKKEI